MTATTGEIGSIPDRLTELREALPYLDDPRRAVLDIALARTAEFCDSVGSRKSPAGNTHYEEAIEAQVDTKFQFALAEEAIRSVMADYFKANNNTNILTLDRLIKIITIEYKGVISEKDLSDYLFGQALDKWLIRAVDGVLSVKSEQE